MLATDLTDWARSFKYMYQRQGHNKNKTATSTNKQEPLGHNLVKCLAPFRRLPKQVQKHIYLYIQGLPLLYITVHHGRGNHIRTESMIIQIYAQ